MKQTVVKVEIVFENPKLDDCDLKEAIELLGSGTTCSAWGKALWKLGNFNDFRVLSVKKRKG